MSHTNDYQGCLRALSRAISQSVAAVQSRCTPDAKPSDKPLLETMRGLYAQSVKPMFEHKKADEAVERELGTAFGAMITHLQAVEAGWQVFRTSNNKLIDLGSQSRVIAEQAVRAGEACYNAAVEAVSRLMVIEAQVRNKAETFIEMVSEHGRATDHVYRSSPHSTFFTYSPLGVYLAEQTRKSVRFEFTYWDGADAIMADLGSLYPSVEDRKVLDRLAALAFGAPVRFTSNYSVIEIDEATGAAK